MKFLMIMRADDRTRRGLPPDPRMIAASMEAAVAAGKAFLELHRKVLGADADSTMEIHPVFTHDG